MSLACVFRRGFLLCVSSFLATKGLGGVLLLWQETENSAGVVAFSKDELLDELTNISLMRVFVKLSWQVEFTNRFSSIAFLFSGTIPHLRNPVVMSDFVSDSQDSLKSLVKFVLLQLIGYFQ